MTNSSAPYFPGSAWLDPTAVLIKRFEELADKGLLHLVSNMVIKVQVLGDASTEQLAEISRTGVTVKGVSVKIRFLLGGDLKFLNSMLGLQNNAALFPCPFCIIHKDLGPRSNAMQIQLAHVEPSDCCPGHMCWTSINPDTHQAPEMTAAEMTRHCQNHFSTKLGLGVLSTAIALEDVLIDVLHVVLRVERCVHLCLHRGSERYWQGGQHRQRVLARPGVRQDDDGVRGHPVATTMMRPTSSGMPTVFRSLRRTLWTSTVLWRLQRMSHHTCTA